MSELSRRVLSDHAGIIGSADARALATEVERLEERVKELEATLTREREAVAGGSLGELLIRETNVRIERDRYRDGLERVGAPIDETEGDAAVLDELLGRVVIARKVLEEKP